MNNVLEDSLFVSQNKKFDEIQSIIKDNIFAVIQNYARKKLRGSGFAVQSMMMNMGVDFLKAGYDFCVRKYGTSTRGHLDAMSTLSKMYEHAYDEGGCIRFLTETESERLMGLPEGWTKYGADGMEIRPLQRYKALGNAIALPCADYIMAGIYEVLADRAGKEE